MDASAGVRLGRSGLTVTQLGLGCAPIGGLFQPVSDADAHAVVDRAWEHGLRLFDTAPLYGSGLSERRLGHALGGRPRGELVLSTKVGRVLRAGGKPDSAYEGALQFEPVFDFSYDGALRSLSESLERLGLDRVDIVHIHDPDDHFDEARAGAYPALERLRDEGVVGAIGVGMNQSEMLARFARDTDVDCFLLAGRYTLLDTRSLAELLPLCLERRIKVIAGGVFNSGVLAGGAHYNYAPAPPDVLARVRRLTDVCARWNIPLSAAAVQFPLGHPAVACVLVGCRSAREVDDNVALFQLDLPAGLWEELRAEGLLPAEAPVPPSPTTST
jgi:D-threo-aldose 1-dehydrogenase